MHCSSPVALHLVYSDTPGRANQSLSKLLTQAPMPPVAALRLVRGLWWTIGDRAAGFRLGVGLRVGR